MSTSLKSLTKKHHCTRQRCLGDAQHYHNYLHPQPRHHKPKRPSTRSQHSRHEAQFIQKPSQQLADQSEVSELKRRNQEAVLRNSQLLDQLQEKGRRINQLKHRLKDYEERMRGYEKKIGQLQSIIDRDSQSQGLQGPTLLSFYQQQLRTFESSQKMMFEQVEKYRMIERQYQQYKINSEGKVEKLQRQNQQLRQYQFPEKDYDGDILELRRELNRLSGRQSPQPGSSSHEAELSTLRAHSQQLLIDRERLVQQVQQQAVKENQLRNNLKGIHSKVESWGEEYRALVKEKRILQERVEHLQIRGQQKREKHQIQKQEWAHIFRDLMSEVDKLKRQMARLQRSNQKFVSLYSELNQ